MTEYKIIVKSSNRSGAGTDSEVYLCFIDGTGKKSEAQNLDNFFRNDFERGQIDEFTVTTERMDVCDIEVWRDNSGFADSWHMEYIMVEEVETKKKVVFPFYRWVEANKHYFIEAYDSVLPQHAKYLQQRNEELAKRKQNYQYVEKVPGLPLQLEKLPEEETFCEDYSWDMTTTRISLMLEAALIGVIKDGDSSFTSFDDIFKVYGYFRDMPVPKDVQRWKDDAYFGRQRLNGCNPLLIQLCTEIPQNFKVDPQALGPLLEGKTMADALTGKKLFIIDLTLEDGVTTQKDYVLPSPYCLLYLKDNNDLVPVAIQLFKTPSPDNPVFYANDDETLWLFVKMWFCLSDSTHHLSSGHLAGTHIIMETVCLSVNRTLSPSHPVYRLLEPHFLFLLAINYRGLTTLLAEGGYVDKTMSASAGGLGEIMAKEWGVLDFQKADMMANLKLRRVDDEQVLPNYHYRDDAKLVYQAIHNYVDKMVKFIYKTEQDIIEDTELQNWAKEIVTPKPDGLGLVNMPGNGEFTKHDDITAVATFIISTCSMKHAAVNFSQYDSYAYPPAYPIRLHGQPPKTKNPITEADIMKAMPNMKQMMMTLVVSQYLALRGTNTLGNYEVVHHYHPDALKIYEEFRKELKEAGATMIERDQQRSVPYEILHPSMIPNSISI